MNKITLIALALMASAKNLEQQAQDFGTAANQK